MQSLVSCSKNFGVIRRIIWPIKKSELVRFIPMASLLFMIWLNHNVVRSIKDGLIVTQVGPEVISFIKLWVEMPIGVIFIIIYTKMCNVMSTESAFRYIVIFFLAFFTIFAFVIYPNQKILHPDPDAVEYYKTIFPHLKWFFVIWGKWSFTMYYVMGELWPIVVSTLLFWQLANKITKIDEAPRFYSFFCLFGQISLIIAGMIVKYGSSEKNIFIDIFCENNRDQFVLKFFSIIELTTGILALLIHRFIELNIIENKNFCKKNKIKINKNLKLGIKDSFSIILRSKYLGIISILVISYSVTVNLIEGLWFSKVKEFYPSLTDFMNYQGTVLSFTGMFAIICALLGNFIIRNFGWFWSAVSTPLMIMIAGSLMFVSIMFQSFIGDILKLLDLQNFSSLAFIVFIGGLQNILGKGVKYSLFDSTKEMVYIPLEAEMKTKGKAAVDVVGAKLGKSTGAIIQFLAFTLFPGAIYNDIAGILFSIFLLICVIWILGVRSLSNAYSKLKNEKINTES